MSRAEVYSETIHASCVAIGGRGVLLSGRSGRGKSDLALRLIDRGARLVSDDYTLLVQTGDRLLASAPGTIMGKIEVRGVGIVSLEPISGVPVCLFADLDGPVERMREDAKISIAGAEIPRVAIGALEASAPIKLEYALQIFGLFLP